MLLRCLELGAEHRLHLGAVDDARHVRVLHRGPRQAVTLLQWRAALHGAVDRIEFLEGALCPDDEAAEIAAWRELQQVQAVHRGCLHTGNVPHGPDDTVILAVHDQRALAHGVPPVAHLALACAYLLRVDDALELLAATQALQRLQGYLRLLHRLEAVGDHRRELRHIADAVAAGHDQWRQGARCERSHNGMALLRDVHAAVPTAPNLRGVEHAAATGLIAEGGLASAVGASARRARNTSNSAASAPRLRSGVVADLVLHGVGLAVILGDIGVDVAD
mmetsp:Transcript_116641/g.238594  ORF Transcript_116641/g.238594 Transcript_116641/m.238594 type:complete len:277 (+) Transcript_116641:354-1184(+)